MWRKSIQFGVGAVLIIQTTLIMTGFGFFNYFETRSRMRAELNELADITADRLSKSIVTFLWNVDSAMIRSLTHSEMMEKQIYAIFVNNDKGVLFSGQKRDKEWAVINHRPTADWQAPAGAIIRRRNIVKRHIKLGSVEIYFTTEFMRRSLNRAIIKIAILAMVINGTLFATFFINIKKRIINPIKDLSQKLSRVAQGDLTVRVQTETETEADEVGKLKHAVCFMLETLRRQARESCNAGHTIASSITEISAAAEQLAFNSSETSDSVSQIAITAEEIRQTAYIANERSQDMEKGATWVRQVADAGKNATRDAISGMNRIREEMTYIADSIVRLGECTQSIGEIIAVVNDLADQSNLLSVNASIEAAKAGEHGKGFAVVAQEVKSLADQSKGATNQVRKLLNDIRKAAESAVQAADRGTQAVQNGAYLSEQAGQSIDKLAESAAHSSDAAFQIATSSQEQIDGMEQLVDEMGRIKDASMRNQESARQLEKAVKNLDELAQNLNRLS